MHGLDGAIHWVVQASMKNSQFAKYHQRPNAPWRGTICIQVHSLRIAIFMQRGSKKDASQRLLVRATIVSAKVTSETMQLFEPHLHTALPLVQRSGVPRSTQLTVGRVGSLRMKFGVVVYCCCCLLF